MAACLQVCLAWRIASAALVPWLGTEPSAPFCSPPRSAVQRLKQLRRHLVAAERKLLFFLSWANEQLPEAYELLALAAAGEHQKHTSAVAEGSGSGQAAPRQHEPAAGAAPAAWAAAPLPVPAARQPQVLIEEI